jgi:hypothetical protein
LQPRNPKVRFFISLVCKKNVLNSICCLAEVTVKLPFRHRRGVGLALTMGQGDVGQLGLGEDVLEKNRPAAVNKIKDLVDVYAGGMHTVCLTANGELVIDYYF